MTLNKATWNNNNNEPVPPRNPYLPWHFGTTRSRDIPRLVEIHYAVLHIVLKNGSLIQSSSIRYVKRRVCLACFDLICATLIRVQHSQNVTKCSPYHPYFLPLGFQVQPIKDNPICNNLNSCIPKPWIDWWGLLEPPCYRHSCPISHGMVPSIFVTPHTPRVELNTASDTTEVVSVCSRTSR